MFHVLIDVVDKAITWYCSDLGRRNNSCKFPYYHYNNWSIRLVCKTFYCKHSFIEKGQINHKLCLYFTYVYGKKYGPERDFMLSRFHNVRAQFLLESIRDYIVYNIVILNVLKILHGQFKCQLISKFEILQ